MRSASLKQQRHQATAETLVRAVETAIVRKGYDSVTMRDIAREVGCAPGTLYLYFKSKRDLVNALIERHGSTLYQRIVEAMGASPDPIEKLRHMSQALLEYFNENRDFFRIFYTSTWVTPGQISIVQAPSIRRRDEEIRQMEIEIIRQAQELGEIRRDFPPESIRDFRQGLTIGLLGQLSAMQVLPSQEEQLRMLWGFQTGGIGARGAVAAP